MIAGRPNAGKSTLLNAVLGENLSIATPKPQTTRETLRGILTEKEKGQIVFVDTPGIHRAREGSINAYMMEQVDQGLEAPDLVWYLVDPDTTAPVETPVLEKLEAAKAPVFLVLNKSDLGRDSRALEQAITERLVAAGVEIRSRFLVSASKKIGLAPLLEQTWAALPEGQAFYPDDDSISDRPVRYFVAEKIREQLFLCLGEELPYSAAVHIERYDESSTPPRIEAKIVVERDSQKGMVIGKGGAKIKEIGSESRKTIEKFVGQKVFLGLKVEVIRNWTSDPKRMKELGYVFASKSSSRSKR